MLEIVTPGTAHRALLPGRPRPAVVGLVVSATVVVLLAGCVRGGPAPTTIDEDVPAAASTASTSAVTSSMVTSPTGMTSRLTTSLRTSPAAASPMSTSSTAARSTATSSVSVRARSRRSPTPAPSKVAPVAARASSATVPSVAGAPATLGALNRWMNAAVLARGTVAFTHHVVVSGRSSDTVVGKVVWRKGVPTFDVTSTGDYVRVRFVVVPGGRYSLDLDQAAQDLWVKLPEKDEGLLNEVASLVLLARQMNPARMHPNLPGLTVRRSGTKVVGGARCTLFTVRMTAAQYYSASPAAMRPSAEVQAGGKATVTYAVDSHGLPHQVIAVLGWASGKYKGSYREISSYDRWGARMTVRLPSGARVVP